MIKESVCCWLSCYQSHGRQYAGREETEGFMRVRGFIIIQLNVNKFFVCGIFLSLFLFIIITIMIFFGPPVSVCIVSYAKGSLLLFFYGLPLFQLVFFSSGLCVLFLYSGSQWLETMRDARMRRIRIPFFSFIIILVICPHFCIV